uniref:Arylamine N-acetyltransferase n=1 Tax=Chrysotila carterae TaxID=13221 RepID=A0A7S4FCR8_CHRCT
MREPYLRRLGLTAPAAVSPTRAWLAALIAAQLSAVPFENVSLHSGTPISLSLPDLTDKIIHRGRGGFCFEVNYLFSELLKLMGYTVLLVPARVYAGDGFRGEPTHIVILVGGVADQPDHVRYLVDVGFGEPCIEPLLYDVLAGEQRSVEGMRSRIVEGESGEMVLEWCVDDSWKPRLSWTKSDAARQEALPFESIQAMCDTITAGSIFTEKLIVCMLTEHRKTTLAGSRLKVTSPRFGAESSQTVTQLTSLDEVRAVLDDKFGIRLTETQNLDMGASYAADPAVWSQL